MISRYFFKKSMKTLRVSSGASMISCNLARKCPVDIDMAYWSD